MCLYRAYELGHSLLYIATYYELSSMLIYFVHRVRYKTSIACTLLVLAIATYSYNIYISILCVVYSYGVAMCGDGANDCGVSCVYWLYII